MKVLMDTGGIAGTNCYLIVDESTKACVLFDAPDHTVDNLLAQVRSNGWKLAGLWLTHGHFDHLADHKAVTDTFPGTPIVAHRNAEEKLMRPGSTAFPLPFTIPPGKADRLVDDGDELELGALKCRVLYTPGHSSGHVMYHFESEAILVGGDLIIGGAIGRYDLPDSNFDDLKQSIRRVMTLPPQTKLLPGHGEPSTLEHEATSNFYVRQILEARA